MDKNKQVKTTTEPVKPEPNKTELKPDTAEKDLGIEKTNKIGLYVGAAIIILAGILSGYFLSQSNKFAGSGIPGMTESKKVVGSTDTKAFPDSTEGTLEEGGINGEGTHKLIRPGGESQTVYLTSSVVDLDQFIGKKVKVWGETLAAQKAGWFMDVGRVEIME